MIMADNNENKVLNVPHLRFPEFSGEWDSFKLVELGKFIGGGTPSSSNLSFWTGSIPWISSSDIKEDNINNISISRYITEDAIEKSATKYCPAPVILIVSRVGVGKVALSHTSLCTSQDFCNIIDIKCHPVFLSYNLLRTMKRKSREVQGTSIKGITSDELQKIRVFIPKNKDEQNKISNLLTLLDERIATQNKIIEDLKKLKSAISKYLFARKDLLETTICLSNIATLKNGYAFQSGKYNALGKWKILTITNVPGERYINDEDCNCIINLPNDIQDHQVLKEGDILISLTGNVGRVSLCKNGNYLLNQRVGLLQLAKNVNQEFLYQILSSQRFENSMIACGQGAAQMNIGKGDVENYVLPYSSNGNNILFAAKILHSYDECIINELRRLTLLTMQKQYLLTQMFI